MWRKYKDGEKQYLSVVYKDYGGWGGYYISFHEDGDLYISLCDLGKPQETRIDEPVYKCGDDVWYFDNEGSPTICHCDITEVSIKKGQFPSYYVFERTGRRIGWLPGHSLFPSREALCEHYRKIFE